MGTPDLTPKIKESQILRTFELTGPLLEKAGKYVMESVVRFDTQRDWKPVETSNRKSWRERLKQADRAYRGILNEDRPYKGQDDQCAPIVHDNVETIKARLMEAIFPTNYENLVEIDIKGGTPEDLAIKQIRQDEINYQLEKLDVEQKAQDAIHNIVLFGDCFVHVPFVNEQHVVMTRQVVMETVATPIIDDNNVQMVNQFGQPMFHVEQVPTLQIVPEVDSKYYGPGYEVITDNERVYMDANIGHIQKQPIVIIEMLVSWEQLLQGAESGIYLKEQVNKVKDAPDVSINSRGLYYSDRSSDVKGSVSPSNTGDRSGKPKDYRLFLAYANMEIEAKNEQGESVKQVHKVVISVVNNICLQLDPNPYFHQMIPIIQRSYHRIPGEAYGMSAVEPILGMFNHYNDTMNQVNDGKTFMIQPITIVRGNTIANQQDYPVAPGEIWTEKEQGDIRPYTIEFPLALAQQYLELLEQRINRGMGITPLLQGNGDATDLDSTWRGTNKLIAQADKKFKQIAKSTEDGLVREWAEMAYKVNCQFFPLLSNTGVEFRKINSEASFCVKGVDSWFEKHEQIDTYKNFVAGFATLPGMNVPGIVNTIAEMEGIKIDETKWGPLYTPPQPLPPPEKPINVSVNVPIDPAKGQWEQLMASQILAQKGLVVDLDAIKKTQDAINLTVDPVSQEKSGTLPPKMDSYKDGDSRGVENDK